MQRQMKWPLMLFAVGVFMAALDNGIITSSLTTLNASFGVTPTWGAWTITLYTLGLAVSVPIAGKLSDRYGRKKLFLIEVALFGIGSLLVALSTSFTFFLISRVIQALGGGGIFIIASSYVLSRFPAERQGSALGILGGMNGIAAILGPNVGSFILDVTGNWHWLFLINVPIAILLFVAGIRYIQEEQELNKAAVDWSGIAVLTLGVLSLMYSFSNLDGVNMLESIVSPMFYGFFAGGIAILIIFYYLEKRLEGTRREPVVSTRLLGIASFRWTLLIAFFSGAILASVIFIPGFVEQYLGVSNTASGYWFTPLALASGIGAGGGGYLVDRKGPIWTLSVAGLLSAIGFLLFPLWVEDLWQFVIASVLVGIGFGMMLGAPVNVLVTEQAGENNKGIAVATSSLFRQMAMAIAPTIFAGFLARSFTNLGTNVQHAFTDKGIQVQPEMMDQFASEGAASSDVSSLTEGLAQIPDQGIRDTLLEAVHQTTGQGYSGLFWSAVIFSVLTLVAALITGRIRSREKSLQSNEAVTNS